MPVSHSNSFILRPITTISGRFALSHVWTKLQLNKWLRLICDSSGKNITYIVFLPNGGETWWFTMVGSVIEQQTKDEGVGEPNDFLASTPWFSVFQLVVFRGAIYTNPWSKNLLGPEAPIANRDVLDPLKKELHNQLQIPAPSKGCQMVPLQGVNSSSLRD